VTSAGVRVRGAVLAFAAAFVLSIAGSATLVAAVAGSGDAAAERAFALSSRGLMACACFEGLLLLTVALVAARLEGRGVLARLRLTASRAPSATRWAAVLGLVGLTFAYGAAAELARLRGEGVLDLLAAALRAPGAGRFAWALVTLSAVPAVGEEALFRGYVQPGLSSAFGRWPAIVLTSIAFGAFHRDLVQGTGAFVAGLFLGWTVERTGGLGPAILAHAVNNATFVVLASFGAAGALPVRVEVATLVIGAATCAAAAFTMARSPSAGVDPARAS
jgi:membrane protease YdiL (CAAX protease family)